MTKNTLYKSSSQYESKKHVFKKFKKTHITTYIRWHCYALQTVNMPIVRNRQVVKISI